MAGRGKDVVRYMCYGDMVKTLQGINRHEAREWQGNDGFNRTLFSSERGKDVARTMYMLYSGMVRTLEGINTHEAREWQGNYSFNRTLLSYALWHGCEDRQGESKDVTRERQRSERDVAGL